MDIFLTALRETQSQEDDRPKYHRYNNNAFRRLKGKYIYDFGGIKFLTQNSKALIMKEKDG